MHLPGDHLGQTMMQTSARNQWSGQVKSIQAGAVNDEVTLEIAGGQHIVAIITHASTLSLGLHTGADAFALLKASEPIVLAGHAKAEQFSARNCLQGQLLRLSTGKVNSELTIGLPGGAEVVAIIRNESSTELGLAVGDAVSVIFKASSVIIGVLS